MGLAQLIQGRFRGVRGTKVNFLDQSVESDIRGAKLKRDKLRLANFFKSRLSGAVLTEADLSGAAMVNTELDRTQLIRATACGISDWDLDRGTTAQDDLIITGPDKPVITVENLEIAQFVHLFLNNKSKL